ncbi:MAG: class I SAM-dependent methyltransferase [Anaerolineae bacterium]|nr:class I SAM-dependent methyltransferase [Anaerolineae bacterium]
MAEACFNEQVAAHYDEDSNAMYRSDLLQPTVDFLAALAGDGAALEFGIGTGRVALPLSARGVPVHGVDISEPMLAQLRRKPGSDQIGITCGDFANTRIPGSFRLVYLVYNTIMNLTTQDEQVACFGNAAAHLEPGGYFVIEVGVPNLRRVPPGERVRAFTIGQTRFGFDEYTDFTNQILYSHHYWTDSGKLRSSSAPFRWVWPAELDLMARLAGMTLRERWAGWNRDLFTDESDAHVSVWQKLP